MERTESHDWQLELRMAKEAEPPLMSTPGAEPVEDSEHINGPDIGRKAEAIVAAYERHDVPAVAHQATTAGGLLNDELRRKTWPMLLGYHSADTSPDTQAGCTSTKDASIGWEALPKHKDEEQVQLDVNRSFVYYPKDISQERLEERKLELSNVIIETLRRHPTLCYFQGFHDIVQVFLLVLGPADAVKAVEHLSLLRIRDFMLSSLAPSLAQLHLIPAILYRADSMLYAHLSQIEPFFALASTITLYAHEIQEYGEIARLYDFLLARGAIYAIYLFVVIIISRKKELMEIPADDPDMLQFTLGKLPQPLDLDTFIQQTMTLFALFPPQKLPSRAWWKISTNSVLKTTRGINEPLAKHTQPATTLQEGEALFSRQVKEVNRDAARQRIKTIAWKNRRAIGGAGLTCMIGLLAFWLQRQPTLSSSILGWVRRHLDLIHV